MFSGGTFNPESLTSLNTATIQVIVNDFHTKIEKLNEELVHLVIEKDELQVNINLKYSRIAILCEMFVLYFSIYLY